MEERLKILVVDDDVVDRMAIRRALKATEESVELSEVENYEEAIAALNQQTFDAIFLDYRLPDADGLVLLQQWRTAGFKMPIIVLTGQGDEQIAVEMMKAGASDYLPKGKLSAQSLVRSLRNAIRIYRAETEAVKAQARLKVSEERYRLVLEGSNDAIWDWDILNNEIYWNDRLIEIIGLSAAEFGVEGSCVARTWDVFSQLLHPDDRQKIKNAILEHLYQNIEFNLEVRLRHKSGEYRHCMTRGKVQRDSQGRPVRMAGIISDITIAKAAQEELHRSFDQLQIIYQITNAVSRAAKLEEIYQIALNGLQRALKADRTSVLLFDSDGVMRFKAWYKLSEQYRQALEGHSPWSSDTQNARPICISDLETDSSLEPWRNTILAEGIRALAFIPLKTGGFGNLPLQEKLLGKFMLYYDRPHQFTEEEIQLAQTIASNVAFAAERKLAEEALHRREQEFKALVENAPDIIARYNKQLEIIYINPAIEKATGLTAQSLIGQNMLELTTAENLTSWQSSLQQVFATGEEQAIELSYTTPDGTMRYYQARLVPELSREGLPEYVLSVARDITDRKQAEDYQKFLADASTILSVSLDYEITWSNLANLAVPQIADWCTIDVLDGEGNGENTFSSEVASSLQRVAFCHADPMKMALLQQWQQVYSDYPSTLFGVTKVLQTGKSQFYPDVEREIIQKERPETDQLALLRELAPKSVMCVPLVARGRTLGAITLGISDSQRQYTRADLELVEDLARRAALAVDNARLYQESQEASDNLRRAIVILGEQQQQLRTLQRMTNLLNQRLANLPDLLQVMVQSVCDAIFGAQFCLIVLHNPQCDRLVLTVTAGVGTEKLCLEDALADGEGWLSQVVATGEYQFIQPVDSDRQSEEEIASEPSLFTRSDSSLPASVYAVPIESAQAGRLGVLAVGNWDDPQAFDPEDRHLLMAVGEQAAIAINNARLIKTLEEREERLAIQNEMLASQNRELDNQRHQIQLQNLQLLEAARLKSQFLATVSHELRTPMNAIIGFSQLLLRQLRTNSEAKVQPEQENMVERILNNGKHLLTLINDILDLSKIEAGRMELEREEINLVSFVTNTTEELRPLAEEKSLDLQVCNDLSDPIVINDSARLRQILINLLSNAIKFTNVGGIRVEVCEMPDNRVAFMVVDTGIGISEAHLEHIFEEFRQVDQTTTKFHYGTGLGLAIIKSLVHLMKGKITVSSKVGNGSSFRVEIPRVLPSSNIPNSPKKARRILK
ncbi:MAG TPA: GAF domain-containing protein [Leptolyngbyaceae cyanobacterium]